MGIKPIKQPHSGYLYAIENNDGCYKLGRTKNLIRRLRTLQTGNQQKLRLVYSMYVHDAVKAEASLHALFTGSNIHGEWYKLTEKELSLLQRIFSGSDLTQIEKNQLHSLGLHQ